MEQWIAFAQDRWYLIVAALVVLFIVMRIVKTVVKWVIVLAVLAVIVVYGANYKDKLQSVGASLTASVGEKVASEASAKALQAFKDEAKDAKFKANSDGSFTITTKSLKVEGKPGDSDVAVTFLGQTFRIKADAAVKAFIEQAKANSNS